MNLVLFEAGELGQDLVFDDPRAVHMREILGLGEGDVFAAGIIGGPAGTGVLTSAGRDGWKWTFLPGEEPPPLKPLLLVLGCPRPPVARRLLKDMSTIGIREIRVCMTDLNEKSYLTSRLWRDGLWRDAIVEGAAQAASTRLPAVHTASGLEGALADLPAGSLRMALDNEPGLPGYNASLAHASEAVLAVGSERGWTGRERAVLDTHGFVRVHLGRRILRTETACSVGAGLLLSAMNRLD